MLPRNAHDSLLGSPGWTIKSSHPPGSPGVWLGSSPIFIDCNSHSGCRSQLLSRDPAAPTHLGQMYLWEQGPPETHSSWLSKDKAVLSPINVLTPTLTASAHSEHQLIPTAAETSKTSQQLQGLESSSDDFCLRFSMHSPGGVRGVLVQRLIPVKVVGGF